MKFDGDTDVLVEMRGLNPFGSFSITPNFSSDKSSANLKYFKYYPIIFILILSQFIF